MSGKVEVYGKPEDEWTQKTIELLEKKGALVSFLDVDRLGDAAAEVLARGGRIHWPQVFINNRAVGGWKDVEELERKGDLDEWLATRFQQHLG